MKQILKDFIYFTNMENIENLNHNIQEKFSLEKTEIEDQNIEKVQFDNLKFGIYFSKNTENGEKILIFKNKRNIKCGNYFINGVEKGFYTDLYFLVFYQDGKDRNRIFEELIEKILRIIKIKKINWNRIFLEMLEISRKKKNFLKNNLIF